MTVSSDPRWRLVEADEVVPVLDAGRSPAYCGCTIGRNHPILLSADYGSFSIVCATCRLGIEYLDVMDGMEFLCASEIPLAITFVTEKHSGPDGVEYDEWAELTLREVTG